MCVRSGLLGTEIGEMKRQCAIMAFCKSDLELDGFLGALCKPRVFKHGLISLTPALTISNHYGQILKTRYATKLIVFIAHWFGHFGQDNSTLTQRTPNIEPCRISFQNKQTKKGKMETHVQPSRRAS